MESRSRSGPSIDISDGKSRGITAGYSINAKASKPTEASGIHDHGSHLLWISEMRAHKQLLDQSTS
ncbi:hypothetical protein PILCRDRAFT_830294 [Piloderma croceum F 1598]|uniref:Uncharacterized protein n=1 Tax=Piloderma croceum (strain F 1598) TaxID=765440 RepID=A0A0C3ETU7_PILCF|nr:hypothetical protein PILCRDRAFT_830294 [Piloderma croceum F 1598]